MGGVQRVDAAVAVVIGSAPHLLGQVQRHLPVGDGHVRPVPQVDLAAEVKHQRLQEKTEEVTI